MDKETLAIEAAKIGASLTLLMETAGQEGAEGAARSAAEARLRNLDPVVLGSLSGMGLWPIPEGVGGIAQALGHAQIELTAMGRLGEVPGASSGQPAEEETVVSLQQGEGMYL